MIRYFASHPTAANVLMLVFLLLGIVAIPSMKKETFPVIEKYQVEVSVAYPGASASDVEEGICQPLEDATDGINYIEEKSCEAKNSTGVMTLKMQEQGDMLQFIDDINRAVDGIDSFPDDVEDPIVQELNLTSQVISIAISANASSTELKYLAEYYKNKLLQQPNIPIVDIQGFSDRLLKVEVEDYNLQKYGLSVDSLANIIKSQALDLPTGELETQYGSHQIKFVDLRRTPEQLEELIIISGEQGGEVRLGDIATVTDTFETKEDKIIFNGNPAAILKISKNKADDSLKIFDAVTRFVAEENARLPEGVKLYLTEDSTSIVKDRLQLLLTNSWQGIILVILALFLFFSARYTFWVAMGLPVSFMASFLVISAFGVSINMISMVGMLIAIGILMDDAIVISESIATEYKKGLSPLDAAVAGVKRVARGILSSFVTTILIFGGLLFLKGDIGQVLKVLPIVLISVLTVSLIEAFLILPHHLKQSLEKQQANNGQSPRWRQTFADTFEKFREKVGRLADLSVKFRYAFVGLTFAALFLTISLIPAGVVKFKGFPDIDGDIVQALILLPQGTPLEKTEEVVKQVVTGLKATDIELSANEKDALVRNIRVDFNKNSEAYESGTHIATVSVDLLSAETRNTTITTFARTWREKVGDIPDIISLQYKEPSRGPAGRPIKIRLQADSLEELSAASNALQNWLRGYPGVVDVADDLRPGKPEFSVNLQEGVLGIGINAQDLSQQLRAAYQGVKVDEVQYENETYEIKVMLADESKNTLTDFDYMTIIHPQTKQAIPLAAIANIDQTRSYARINRLNNIRTVTVYGEIESDVANAAEIIMDTQRNFFPELAKQYPEVKLLIEGESKNNKTTGNSFVKAFLVGIAGIFFLLSLQFRNYIEPIIVLVAIPLSLIGVIWGHYLLGLDLSMPSVMGFVSLAGIVINNSILLVEFVKLRVREGMSVHDAASQATRDRFRAIFLTSLTTVMGMLPLLFETSFQAKILIPLVASITFGLIASTILVLIVLPALYSILEDFGVTRIEAVE
ncbi:efflux RND transporter permease subunit [Spartinivicinus ruber]|uniref:efflux RND transporter permease subunit n=1 Tax=Spartinivicinus ruber TaxID=2683272 RepID=UPI0013D230E0|nr:efflux RND transporter permease subunit [Spartinivicinus ruber]